MRNKINFGLNCFQFICVLILAVSGLVRWLVLSSGYGYGYQGGRFLNNINPPVFIFDRHTWGDIHQWTAVIFLVLIVLHLILHWRWITAMFKNFFLSK
jgi:hypothetical protein